MSDNYLELAKIVLETRARPMTAQQILEDARRHGLWPAHLVGETMHKTLQARIAEDIFTNRSRSIFYRTNIGTYFIRSLAHDRTLPAISRVEFEPPRRARPLPSHRILFLRAQLDARTTTLLPNSEFENLDQTQSSYHFAGQEPANAFKVMTLTLLTRCGSIFSYKVGKHSYISDLVGQRSLGLRRFIDEYDLDLFGSDRFGVELNAAREVLRHIGHTNPTIDDRAIRNRMSHLGVLIEPSQLRVSMMVLVDLTTFQEFSEKVTRRLEVNSPAWIPIDQRSEWALDYASQAILGSMVRDAIHR